MQDGLILRVDQAAQYRAHAEDLNVAVQRVLASGSYVLGREVEAFEREFSEYIGGATVVALADGTRAISLALKAAGLQSGQEVVTTPFTAIPTIGAIIEAGGLPVFVDIDPETWLIDIDAAAEAVTDRTAAIVPVHMFGNVVDIPRLKAALGRPLPIIEDAAQAHGSRLGGRHVGVMGDFGTFSFYPTKNLGGYGDGGAVVSNDREKCGLLRLWRNHGMQNKDLCVEAGVNSRLDEIQAAILRVKLKALDDMNAARAALVAAYREQLPMERFAAQRPTEGATVNHHMFQLRFDGDRDALVSQLMEAGIQTNVYYAVPHHLQPALAHLGYRRGDFPVIEKLCLEGIALPLYPEMPFEVVERTAATIRTIIGR